MTQQKGAIKCGSTIRSNNICQKVLPTRKMAEAPTKNATMHASALSTMPHASCLPYSCTSLLVHRPSEEMITNVCKQAPKGSDGTLGVTLNSRCGSQSYLSIMIQPINALKIACNSYSNGNPAQAFYCQAHQSEANSFILAIPRRTNICVVKCDVCRDVIAVLVLIIYSVNTFTLFKLIYMNILIKKYSFICP